MNKMKLLLPIMALLCTLLSVSCNEKSRTSENGLIEVDLRENPPVKKICLQDIATIEYIPIVNDSNFIPCTKKIGISKDGKNMIAGGEGYCEVLIFDRQGTPIGRIDHEGQGPDEYLYASYYTILGEKIFIYDGWNGKMHVYDFSGNPLYLFDSRDLGDIHIYDEHSFICHNCARNRIEPDYMPYYTIISNQTGEVLERIDLPYSVDKPIMIRMESEDSAGEKFITSTRHIPLIKGIGDNFILNELSTDTIYQYSAEGAMSAIIVRKPSIKEDNQTFLEFCLDTKDYYFMLKTSVNRKGKGDLFPTEQWVYDKNEMKTYQAEITNEDFPEQVLNFTPDFMDTPNGTTTLRYRAYHLCEAYKEGKLYGKLKEIASTLSEEDNDVYVLVKFK